MDELWALARAAGIPRSAVGKRLCRTGHYAWMERAAANELPGGPIGRGPRLLVLVGAYFRVKQWAARDTEGYLESASPAATVCRLFDRPDGGCESPGLWSQ